MENQEFNQQQEKRPTFLTVLSVFSFISIGFGLLGTLLGLISGKMSSEQMEQVKIEAARQVESLQSTGMEDFSQLFEQIFRINEYINNNFYVHNLVSLLSLLVGLFGVLFMLRAQKKGFHMYIIYNILNLLLVYVSVPANEVPSFMTISNLIFSGLFVFLYSRNLKWMTK